jgi:hydrogenase nickel incorporation protein HypA/HybF
MHELGIVQGTLDLAISTAQKSGAREIHRIFMRVGALAGVVPDSMTFAFEALRQGTMAEKATLEIEQIPAVYWCEKCAAEFQVEDWNRECPKCSQPSLVLRRGRELELTSMEVS